MNFKRIEISGFKSFADKTIINFENGITGVVGPNGCGKSNVADAIRWVLGEQSAKLLRGKSMQDVIFKGTARRKSLSFCSVSLVFDNTDKIFPTVTFDEVIVTRKLYASGDSEYQINGNACRLKDIQDIIRDTGLGREGYSIVGQGKIDEIVKARPKDRRSIFEDAAGVLKYKVRKVESERKLERTTDNISRLDDILKELERQLGPLEKQSEDAKKYLELRDKLKILETNEYIYKYENVDSQKQEVKSKLAVLKDEYAGVEKEADDAESSCRNKTIEMSNVDTYIAKLRDEQRELAVREESIKGQGSTLNERISNLQEQRNNHAKRVGALEESIDKANADILDYSSRINMEKEDKVDCDKKIAETSAKHLALVDEILAREQQIESKNNDMLKAIESIGEIKADLGKLMTEREISNIRIAELDKEIEILKGQIDSDETVKRNYEESVEKYRKNKIQLASSKNEVQSEVSELRLKIDKNSRELSDTNGEINSLKSRISVFEQIKNEYTSFISPVKNLMDATERDARLAGCVQGVVAKLVKVPQNLESAIETALGANAQNIVTETEEQATYVINYLKQHNYGRLTFLPLTSFKAKPLDSSLRSIVREKGCLGVASELVEYDKRFYNIFSGLLGRTLVCEDMECAVAISRKYAYAVKIVTLSGEVISPSGSMTGGSKRSNNTNLFGQDREIETCSKMLENSQSRYQNLLATIRSDKEELEELVAQLTEYEEEVRNAEVQYATENGRLDKVCAKVNDSLQELANKTNSRNVIAARIKLIEQAIENIDRKGEDVNDLKTSANGLAQREKAEFEQKKREKDMLNDKLTELKVQQNAINTAIDNYAQHIERLQQELSDAEEEKQNSKRLVKELDERIFNAENNLTFAVVSDEDKAQYEKIVNKINSLGDYKKKLQTEIEQLNSSREFLNKQKLNISESRLKQESILEKIDEVMVGMELHIKEEYDLDFVGCLFYRVADFDCEKSSSEIAKLRRAKNNLGPVNVDAIETFKEEGARYSQMKEQREDLVSTANDCKKIIVDMSKEMKTRFDVEFAKINTNFKQIIKELFGGGSGEILLEKVEEGEDELDAGVEIYVTPPGKSMTSMSLYSGGEQALIAIAILFAILKLKAMPFCVLDEVEAALDDSNVALFAKYLSRFSQETQFIVITHRKPTMELADRLYGVTMEEKGVSKVVTVSLADAIKHVETTVK
ncbi:MAG: chromosome segregation protein SMC [Clostridia bacterium]